VVLKDFKIIIAALAALDGSKRSGSCADQREAEEQWLEV
jgi:hypothetical protein